MASKSRSPEGNPSGAGSLESGEPSLRPSPVRGWCCCSSVLWSYDWCWDCFACCSRRCWCLATAASSKGVASPFASSSGSGSLESGNPRILPSPAFGWCCSSVAPLLCCRRCWCVSTALTSSGMGSPETEVQAEWEKSFVFWVPYYKKWGKSKR